MKKLKTKTMQVENHKTHIERQGLYVCVRAFVFVCVYVSSNTLGFWCERERESEFFEDLYYLYRRSSNWYFDTE